MHILVLGAAGMVGRKLVERLLRDGRLGKHDITRMTLQDVVAFYAGQGNSNPYLDKEIKAIKISGPERADLIAFLESLTGELPPDAGPPQT